MKSPDIYIQIYFIVLFGIAFYYKKNYYSCEIHMLLQFFEKKSLPLQRCAALTHNKIINSKITIISNKENLT